MVSMSTEFRVEIERNTMIGKFVLCDSICSFSIAFLTIVISDETRPSIPRSIALLEVVELEWFQCRQSSELKSSGIL